MMWRAKPTVLFARARGVHALGAAHNVWFQQTMIRVKDPRVSVPFYIENFGMRLCQEFHFPQWKFSVYFLESPLPDTDLWRPGTEAAERRLFTTANCTIELTHNHGSENDDSFREWVMAFLEKAMRYGLI